MTRIPYYCNECGTVYDGGGEYTEKEIQRTCDECGERATFTTTLKDEVFEEKI